MKKISIIFSLLLAAYAGSLHAQTCSTGFCPATITVHHKAGSVSPVTGDITYQVASNTLTGSTMCWLLQNLGATTPYNTYSNTLISASEGWYWQFNRSRGYAMVASARTPNTTWITGINESSNWLPANDPCTVLLGSTWRIPTATEWQNTYSNGSFLSTFANAYTYLRIAPAAGYQLTGSGAYASVGANQVYFFSSTQYSNTNAYGAYLTYNASNGSAAWNGADKSSGLPLRCLRTY